MVDKQDMDKINEILNGIHPIVRNGNIQSFKDLIQAMDTVENKELLCTCYNNSGIELISLISKYNRKKHLSYLLYESHILHYLANENKTTEMKCKEDSFYYAMCSNNFDTLEILYDYWSGDLHWLGHKKQYNEFDVKNLKHLNNLLKCAFNRYIEHIHIKGKIYPQNILNIESLMAFNVFQTELYSKLNELKASLITWEDEPVDIIRIQETYAIRRMILAVFDIYEKHSEQNLLKNSVLKINQELVDGYSDSSSLIHRSSLFATFETFFRKLDYNFCLLILDNLHLLKLRLSMSKNSYQTMENKLYYFIYHISNKWNLYFPKRRRTKVVQILGRFKGKLSCFSINYNENKNFYNIIFLERRDFERTMKSFKNELRNKNIEENIRKSQMKLPNEDNNCLMLLPHLRDDYSLKRISQHIWQLHNINFKYEKKYAFLFIERTLQVVGEFLKSTNESLHLQPTTEALVKAEISVEVVNDLKALRNLLCHTKNGELLKRIEVEVNNTYIFDLILKELLYVKKKIDDVIKVHKSIVERDLAQDALYILFNRQLEMPEEVAHVHYPNIHMSSQIPNDFFRHKCLNNYYKETWAPKGFSKSLMNEVCMLADHSRKIEPKLYIAKKNVHKNVTLKLRFYRERIKISLKTILTDIEKWREIIKIVKEKVSSIDLLDYPNEVDANRIKSYFCKEFLESNCLVQFVEVNQLFANVEQHWKFIENLLQFIVHETRIFDNTIEQLKFDLYSSILRDLAKHNYKTNDMEKNVNQYLDMLESQLNKINAGKTPPLFRDSNTKKADSEKVPEFSGIKDFTNKLMTANFLTQEEKKHLISTIKNTNYKNNVKQYSAIELMINKIENNVAIPKKEYTKLTQLIKLDSKSQKILMNLVMGHKRNPLLPQCLSNRIFILREIMKEQCTNQLVLRYRLDKTFRVLLEVLLFDILIIMECNKNNAFIKKSSKLLTEINLRNILTHGSPLLEVIGDALDANDLPTELITKAFYFIEDKRSIDALCALSESDFDFIEMDNIPQNSQHKALLNEFKTSYRWKDYLKLLPDYKQNMYKKLKKGPAVDENSMALMKAINKMDAALVQDCIDKGANVNFVDNHKKAMLHYAAMKGSVNVLKILIKNKANVNIANKGNNLTALHYSAMNNFIDSVKFLLDNGANSFALDDKGRTPVYWASQRNHLSVCRTLVQAMKKCN